MAKEMAKETNGEVERASAGQVGMFMEREAAKVAARVAATMAARAALKETAKDANLKVLICAVASSYLAQVRL